MIHFSLDKHAGKLVAVDYFTGILDKSANSNVVQDTDNNQQRENDEISGNDFFSDSKIFPTHERSFL